MKTQSQITVRYAETDQMGIAHHSVYPIWYEVARTDFIKQVGMTYSEMERFGILLPLAGLTCKYSAPALYEDVLIVEAEIKTLTPARIEFAYTVYKKGEDKPINTGTTLHAWVDSDMKLINLKKKFPDIYKLVEKACEI